MVMAELSVNLDDVNRLDPLERCVARDANGARCGDVAGHEDRCSWHPCVEKLWQRIHLRELTCPLCANHPVYKFRDHSALFK